MYYCKKCNNVLEPSNELIKMPQKWENDGARCSQCGYLYYPKDNQTWFKYPWQKDFEEKKEKILSTPYGLIEMQDREIYRLLFFLDSLTKYINYYFSHEIFIDHKLLIKSLNEINAVQTVKVAEKVIDLYHHRDEFDARFLSGSEAVDDAWEDVTFELYQALDSDIEERIYTHYLKD